MDITVTSVKWVNAGDNLWQNVCRPETSSDTTMGVLKLICLTIIQMVKQAWSLPQTVANAVKQRRRQAALDEQEVERLDRIRNPSKYLGK